MSRWFRHYAGMMRDEKLVAVAVKAKQPVERVLWVWGAILESAAEVNDNGRYDIDAAEIAYFLRADEADIAAILDGLSCAERVVSGSVAKWGSRQFQSDGSAARQAAYRERKKAGAGGSDNNTGKDHGGKSLHNNGTSTSDSVVTSRDGEVTSYTTDTDTDKKKDKAKALSKKGTRLPDDWRPTPFGQDFANFNLHSSAAVQSELAKFIDYWRSVPGAKGIKLDWDATWRNWVRSAAERKGHSPPKRQTYSEAAAEIIEEMRHERTQNQGPQRDVQFLSPAAGRREIEAQHLPSPVVRIERRGGD